MQNSARSLVTKMVNALTAKLEIGSPMASMYLLRNPNHYTSHEFVSFYWRSFVCEACSVFSTCGSGPLLAHGSYKSKLKSVLSFLFIYI